MDWQHFKDNVFNGLVSGITVLLVLGTGGKVVFEHWFNRRLKQYEAELTAKADREKAKIDYLHPERAKAALQIFISCKELQRELSLILVQFDLKQPGDPKYSEDALRHIHKLDEQVSAMRSALDLQRLYFTKEAIAPVEELLDYCRPLTRTEVHEPNFTYQTSEKRIANKVKAVEDAFKQVLGSESLA